MAADRLSHCSGWVGGSSVSPASSDRGAICHLFGGVEE